MGSWASNRTMLIINCLFQLIRHVQPNVVVLEICECRLSLLTMDEEALMEKIRDFSYGSINQIIKELGLVQGKLLFPLFECFLENLLIHTFFLFYPLGLIQILFLHHSKELSEKFGCVFSCPINLRVFVIFESLV